MKIYNWINTSVKTSKLLHHDVCLFLRFAIVFNTDFKTLEVWHKTLCQYDFTPSIHSLLVDSKITLQMILDKNHGIASHVIVRTMNLHKKKIKKRSHWAPSWATFSENTNRITRNICTFFFLRHSCLKVNPKSKTKGKTKNTF